MKIIKDRQIVDDHWSHLADDNAISAGDVTVSFARWRAEHALLSNRSGRIGVRLAPTDPLADLAGDLANIHLLGLEFPLFTDGRLFSYARLLRERYQFKHELRAMGNYTPDQVFYLSRVGVNAFQLNNADELQVALSSLSDFSLSYQHATR